MTIEYILVLSKDKRLVVYTSLCTCIFYKIQKMICLKNRQDYGTNLQLRSWERGYNSHAEILLKVALNTIIITLYAIGQFYILVLATNLLSFDEASSYCMMSWYDMI
jgi:hypothetical protein